MSLRQPEADPPLAEATEGSAAISLIVRDCFVANAPRNDKRCIRNSREFLISNS